MSGFVPMNPRPMLQSLINNPVTIRLKWGVTEYTGTLVSVDSYMNVQLNGAEEWAPEDPAKGGPLKSSGVMGAVLIRCNNVLWIAGGKKGKESNGANGDVDMEE